MQTGRQAYIRPLPLRSGELLVRRGLIESGLRLMMSRSLVCREVHVEGFLYGADDSAALFLNNINSSLYRRASQQGRLGSRHVRRPECR